jgi:hypothetical protein
MSRKLTDKERKDKMSEYMLRYNERYQVWENFFKLSAEDFDGSIATYHQAGHQAWLAKNSAYKTMYSFIMSEQRRTLIYANTPQNELLTVAEWHEILKQYDYRCAYCGCLLGNGPDEKHPTKDHVIPIANGGKHNKNNVVPACAHCNSSKNSRTSQEWVIATAKKQTLRAAGFNFASDMSSFQSFLSEMQLDYQFLKSYVSEQPLIPVRLDAVFQQLNVLSLRLDNIKNFLGNSFGDHIQQAQVLYTRLGDDMAKLQQNWVAYQNLNITASPISADAISSAIRNAQKKHAALFQKIAVAQKQGDAYYSQGEKIYQTASKESEYIVEYKEAYKAYRALVVMEGVSIVTYRQARLKKEHAYRNLFSFFETKLQQNWVAYQNLNITASPISADAISSAIRSAQKQQAALSQRIAVAQKQGDAYYSQGEKIYQTASKYVSGLTASGSN